MLPKYKRILLKLSGESLMGDKNFGLDSEVIARYAQDIKSVLELLVVQQLPKAPPYLLF